MWPERLWRCPRPWFPARLPKRCTRNASSRPWSRIPGRWSHRIVRSPRDDERSLESRTLRALARGWCRRHAPVPIRARLWRRSAILRWSLRWTSTRWWRSGSRRPWSSQWVPSCRSSQRQRIEQPPDEDARADESCEEPPAELQLLTRLIAHERRKHDRHEQREDHHQSEVAGHLRPLAMSNASRTTSMLSSPATITKVFPYS